MITINEVSQYAKDKIIMILSASMSADAVVMCMTGLAHEALIRKTNQDWEKEIKSWSQQSPEAQFEISQLVAQELKAHTSEYARLVLTIYAYHTADKFVSDFMANSGL